MLNIRTDALRMPICARQSPRCDRYPASDLCVSSAVAMSPPSPSGRA